VHILTIGHGTRAAEELVEMLLRAGARTLVDVRRFPGSRRNPQFNQPALRASMAAVGIAYRHAVELGGRLRGEPGEERFSCIRTAAFRSYAARMGRPEWQDALAAELAQADPCFMCAESDWRRCHRRLIAELLAVRGHEIIHLVRPDERQAHVPWPEAEARGGSLYLCGELVA
jgi:uncharacterized protein (DUF488 family)